MWLWGLLRSTDEGLQVLLTAGCILSWKGYRDTVPSWLLLSLETTYCCLFSLVILKSSPLIWYLKKAPIQHQQAFLYPWSQATWLLTYVLSVFFLSQALKTLDQPCSGFSQEDVSVEEQTGPCICEFYFSCDHINCCTSSYDLLDYIQGFSWATNENNRLLCYRTKQISLNYTGLWWSGVFHSSPTWPWLARSIDDGWYFGEKSAASRSSHSATGTPAFLFSSRFFKKNSPVNKKEQ